MQKRSIGRTLLSDASLAEFLTSDERSSLENGGIHNLNQFFAADDARLGRILKWSRVESDRKRASIASKLSRFDEECVPAGEFLDQKMSDFHVLSTGTPCVDEILGRGIWVNEITEVVGMGKTHFTLSFIAHLLLTTDRSVAFIDSGGQMDPTRLHKIMSLRAMGTGISEPDIQSKMNYNIRCYPCTDRHEFMAILRSINIELMKKKNDFFSKTIVVIVDCLTSILHTGSILEEDSDEAMWEDRAVLHSLHILTSRHVAILVTTAPPRKLKKRSRVVPSSLAKSWAWAPSQKITLSKIDRIVHSSSVSSDQIEEDLSSSSSHSMPIRLRLARSMLMPPGASCDLFLCGRGIVPL